MFTQFITFAIIVAIIGCIMYGRKLIRKEKVDAVFGNPERAKGGREKHKKNLCNDLMNSTKVQKKRNFSLFWHEILSPNFGEKIWHFIPKVLVKR